MLAPMMIQTACRSVMSSAFTKPTTMTVVAEEDWITAVMPAPAMHALKSGVGRQLLQDRPSSCFPLPVTPGPVLIICIPYRNSASPPKSDNTKCTLILNPLLSHCSNYLVKLYRINGTPGIKMALRNVLFHSPAPVRTPAHTPLPAPAPQTPPSRPPRTARAAPPCGSFLPASLSCPRRP